MIQNNRKLSKEVPSIAQGFFSRIFAEYLTYYYFEQKMEQFLENYN